MTMPADCLFCRMSAGDMDVEKLHEDDVCFAIRDINPRAPVHFMVIPHDHVSTVRDVREEHGAILGRLIAVANTLAQQEGIADDGYRLAFNVGDNAGQTVYHIHLHVLGGRRLGPEG